MPPGRSGGRFGSLPPDIRPLRVGIGGPVGSGKTALVAALCRLLAPRYQTAVITNDIYTKEDAEALLRLGVLPPDRVVAVETGCCPHTAIRDDVAANLQAVHQPCERVPPPALPPIESGGGRPGRGLHREQPVRSAGFSLSKAADLPPRPSSLRGRGIFARLTAYSAVERANYPPSSFFPVGPRPRPNRGFTHQAAGAS